MKILGISNPNWTGVTIATKAICNAWLSGGYGSHDPYEQRRVAQAVFQESPDVLVIGGWSQSHISLLEELKHNGRNYPVVYVHHSTPFHGAYFHRDWQALEFEDCYRRGLIDLLGFVHPQTAEYYQKVRKCFAAFVPHAFKPMPNPIAKPDTYRIGVLGGGKSPYKNFEGSYTVASDYAKNNGAEVIASYSCDKPHQAFLATLSSCSVLVHTSHLECYSNTVQEAWARGIPVITSPASSGLIGSNPLLCDGDRHILAHASQLSSANDPMELYEKLDDIRKRWELHSERVHNIYTTLHARTNEYLSKLFKNLVEDFPNREHDLEFLTSPFSKEGIKWDKTQIAR